MHKVKLNDLIKRCRSKDRQAQKEVYNTYAPLFVSMAMRYVGDRMIAEDIVVQSFYKVFSRINKYSGTGSFEGWMKRILINESLMHLRKHKTNPESSSLQNVEVPYKDYVEEKMEYEKILSLIHLLPAGYKTVFNLYVIEGFKHREIAEILNISINTSKSQLILAKKKMRELVIKHLYPGLNWE